MPQSVLGQNNICTLLLGENMKQIRRHFNNLLSKIISILIYFKILTPGFTDTYRIYNIHIAVFISLTLRTISFIIYISNLLISVHLGILFVISKLCDAPVHLWRHLAPESRNPGYKLITGFSVWEIKERGLVIVSTMNIKKDNSITQKDQYGGKSTNQTIKINKHINKNSILE